MTTPHERSEYGTPRSSVGFVAKAPTLKTLGKQTMLCQVTSTQSFGVRTGHATPVEATEARHDPPTGSLGGGGKLKTPDDATTHAVRKTRLGCEGGTATIGAWQHRGLELGVARRPSLSSANVRGVRRFVGA